MAKKVKQTKNNQGRPFYLTFGFWMTTLPVIWDIIKRVRTGNKRH